jgi:hypothetical protein
MNLLKILRGQLSLQVAYPFSDVIRRQFRLFHSGKVSAFWHFEGKRSVGNFAAAVGNFVLSPGRLVADK